MSRVFSDLEMTTAHAPLVSVADVKTWFKITDETYDAQLELAGDAVSDLIRDYLGRYLFPVSWFKETWPSDAEMGIAALREWPVSTVSVGADIVNRSTGMVSRTASAVEYEGGMVRLPASLTVIIYQLIKQQMSAFGFPEFAGDAAVARPVKSISVGNLKVDYGSAADSDASISTSTGALTHDALIPYSEVLDHYRSDRAWAAT